MKPKIHPGNRWPAILIFPDYGFFVRTARGYIGKLVIEGLRGVKHGDAESPLERVKVCTKEKLKL